MFLAAQPQPSTGAVRTGDMAAAAVSQDYVPSLQNRHFLQSFLPYSITTISIKHATCLVRYAHQPRFHSPLPLSRDGRCSAIAVGSLPLLRTSGQKFTGSLRHACNM